MTTQVLQTYSVIAATLAAGTNFASTIVTLPVVLPSTPSALATQWRILYDSGIMPVLLLAATSAVGFATLAYRAVPAIDIATGAMSHAKRNLYIGAAILAFSPGPYTKVLMLATNKELMRRAKLSEEEDLRGTHELVRKWGRLNFARGMCVLVGAGLGLRASIH